MEIEIVVKGYRCAKCGYEWISKFKNVRPHVCPDCRTRKWDWDKDPSTGKLIRPANPTSNTRFE